REDAKAHEILMSIASGRTLADPKRMRHSTDALYVTSPEEMYSIFSAVPEAVANTQRIDEACNVELELGKPMLPTFKVPAGHDADSYIAELSVQGLNERFKELKYPVDRDAYLARLQLELGVIQRMGFSGYFLIVQDFINWAKRHSIPVGPGRGSGAGSLVAYALRITDLDPIPYNLLFERFLNPERVSMPDFDVDFMQERRGEVIQYVADRYGRERVGQIATYAGLNPKSAIKDVARTLGVPFGEINELTKPMPLLLDGKKPDLDTCLEFAPKLKELAATD